MKLRLRTINNKILVSGNNPAEVSKHEIFVEIEQNQVKSIKDSEGNNYMNSSGGVMYLHKGYAGEYQELEQTEYTAPTSIQGGTTKTSSGYASIKNNTLSQYFVDNDPVGGTQLPTSNLWGVTIPIPEGVKITIQSPNSRGEYTTDKLIVTDGVRQSIEECWGGNIMTEDMYDKGTYYGDVRIMSEMEGPGVHISAGANWQYNNSDVDESMLVPSGKKIIIEYNGKKIEWIMVVGGKYSWT